MCLAVNCYLSLRPSRAQSYLAAPPPEMIRCLGLRIFIVNRVGVYHWPVRRIFSPLDDYQIEINRFEVPSISILALSYGH